jgi:hypothetical protein
MIMSLNLKVVIRYEPKLLFLWISRCSQSVVLLSCVSANAEFRGIDETILVYKRVFGLTT